MKKLGLLALLMAVVLMMTGCSLVVKDPEVDAKRIIIDFGEETVDKATFIRAYNNAYNNELATQQMYQQGDNGSAGPAPDAGAGQKPSGDEDDVVEGEYRQV